MSAESDFLSEVSEGVPSIDIRDFLECPVCTCFVASPIYSCSNGHVVCGICKPKISKCPSCGVKNLAVNGLVERILKSKGVETACRNEDVGCTRIIKVWKMKKHLDNSCDFRLIKCTEIYPEQCEGSYSPKELLQHWISFHGVQTIEVEAFLSKEPAIPTESSVALNLLGVIDHSYYLNENDYTGLNMNVGWFFKWRVAYFKLDSQTFLIHAFAFLETFHVWITLLGEESDANKYRYSCTISSDLCTSQPKREVTFCGILMHSVQYCHFEKVSGLGYTAAIRVQNLKMLQDKKPIDPDHMLDWHPVTIQCHQILHLELI